MTIGQLLLPAWTTTVGDACMSDRYEVSGHPEDDKWPGLVFVMPAYLHRDVGILQGSRASWQVWCPREAHRAFACGIFQYVAWLACLLVERPYKSAWRLSRCLAAVAARLLQLKVRRRCFQAVMPLSVRVIDRPVRAVSYINCDSQETP